MAFNNGNAYQHNEQGYVISRGSIPSATQPKYIPVWSAFTALPPKGERIYNGEDMFFYSQQAAVRACEEHMAGRVAA